MEQKILIGGFGGQGILFLGKIIALAGMLEEKEVTWFPSYGAEVRGGTASCTVIISDEMIGSPVVKRPDSLIVMNEASMIRFLPRLKQGGLLFYDSSLIHGTELRKDVYCIPVPATAISDRIRNTRSANMVLLGAFIFATGLLKDDSVARALEETAAGKTKHLNDNRKAIAAGMKYLEDTKSENIRSQTGS